MTHALLALWLAATPSPTLFQKGKAAFEAGKLAEALALFEEARRTDPAPELLLNIAQCNRGLGRRAEAIAALESFLQVAPAHPLRKAVEGTLADLRAELAREHRDDTPIAPVLVPEPRPAEEATAAPTPPEAPRKIWPWVVGGVGVAAVAGAVTAIVLATRPHPVPGLPELGTLRVPAP